MLNLIVQRSCIVSEAAMHDACGVHGVVAAAGQRQANEMHIRRHVILQEHATNPL